jgi:hypothetical protein
MLHAVHVEKMQHVGMIRGGSEPGFWHRLGTRTTSGRVREWLIVTKLGGIGAIGGAALTALALLLTPALAASTQQKAKNTRPAPSFRGGGLFTPAVADSRLAAEYERRGIRADRFRFTPSAASRDKSKAVRVAVRARAVTPGETVRGEASALPITAITPTAYNLGLSVGWKRFAVSGDVAKVQGGTIPGANESAELGVAYLGKKFTGRVQVGANRNEGAHRIIEPDQSYSLDVGGSYSIARNIDVTGGVRYKIQRDRLQPLEDESRDSQAVYLGTAFRF